MKKVIICILLFGIVVVGCKSKDLPIDNEDEIIDNLDEDEEVVPEDEDAQEDEIDDENISYYLDKLKDKTYISTYGDEQEPSIWYTAAEELGTIGKPAIPYLIKKLKTSDSYEKGLVLYALLLASQDENLKEITNGEYIEAGLTFDEKEQERFSADALKWWEKYKDQF
ncbi:MAG: hypothetical protein CVV02_01095 [Firmicutes bacterium HGW-Firmicutes-7]|nr:MAG: hypothetical protein CVV02_01095 [Firmicutes bacterium HGW-Firmicutes-7]